MITANIRFLMNNLMAELTCKSSELQSNLQTMGILTPPSIIMLDNARTLEVKLTPNDEVGERIFSIVNTKSDTLGNVQRLCRYVYCMNDKDRNEFICKIDNGSIKTVNQALKIAYKMREDNINRLDR